MRLAKYLATAGIASRRASEELVRAGRVTVGEETVVDPARDVDAGDDIHVDGRPVAPASELVVYALHKPVGVVSTASDPQGRRTVVSLVPSELRLYPVGRLDADSSGLILLTNDGELAYRLTHPRFEVPKTYRVRVGNPPVRERAVIALRRGVELEDGRTAPARVTRLAPDQLEITIHEGKKRQLKRMCEAVGHPVKALARVRLASLALGDLAPGAHRRLSEREIAALASAAAAARPYGTSSYERPRQPRSGSGEPGARRRA